MLGLGGGGNRRSKVFHFPENIKRSAESKVKRVLFRRRRRKVRKTHESEQKRQYGCSALKSSLVLGILTLIPRDKTLCLPLQVPAKTLDEAFSSKDQIAIAVKEQLQHEMKEYGYEIIKALVTDLNPDARVKASMNEINAQNRLKEASTARGDGEKILMVKMAEADKESKYLSGLGVAQQRRYTLYEDIRGYRDHDRLNMSSEKSFLVSFAFSVPSPRISTSRLLLSPIAFFVFYFLLLFSSAIVKGLKGSIVDFADGVEGTSAKDVMDLLLVTQ